MTWPEFQSSVQVQVPSSHSFLKETNWSMLRQRILQMEHCFKIILKEWTTRSENARLMYNKVVSKCGSGDKYCRSELCFAAWWKKAVFGWLDCCIVASCSKMSAVLTMAFQKHASPWWGWELIKDKCGRLIKLSCGLVWGLGIPSENIMIPTPKRKRNWEEKLCIEAKSS